MNSDELTYYIWFLDARKKWTQTTIREREARYDKFQRKLYIPTRILRQKGTGRPIMMAQYRTHRMSTLRWIRLFAVRKPWKIMNSFSPGWYR